MQASEGRRRPAAGHVARRWLYLIHRWIGIASCLLFVMWFASGLVMIYVPYPSLSQAERIAHLAPIDWGRVTAPAPERRGVRSLALEMRDGQPIWRVVPWQGEPAIASAEAGRPLARVDAAMAARIAAQFGQARVAAVTSVQRDQWTVAQPFDRQRPLWKVSLDDAAGTQLYVSSITGDLVQHTRRSERFWNWLGSVPHWLYPTVLRRNGEAWRQVVMWVAGPCIAAALTGMWIGILRARFGARRYKGGRVTPYHGWMLWHHVAGLVGGLFLVAWIFSGWLSVDPGRLFAQEGVSSAALHRFAGDVTLAGGSFAQIAGAVRIEALSAPGRRRLLIVTRRDRREQVLDAATNRPAALRLETIRTGAVGLVRGAKVVQIERITTPDAYWYEAGKPPRLPVYRVRFDDPADTWLHIDPRTGQLLGSLDSRGRAYRWLFDLLHKWDFNALTLHRPLWDIVLWAFSLAGLVTSASGVWIGVKRLRR